MADEPVPITFQLGLQESRSPTRVPIGELISCLNWVPEPDGSLRARAKWFQGSTDGIPDTRKGRGIGIFQRASVGPSGPRVVQQSTFFIYARNIGPGPPAGSKALPTITFPTPTQSGNILVASIGLTATAGTANIDIATSWTERRTPGGTVTSTASAFAVYELETTQSYATLTPFDFTLSSSTLIVAIQVYELAGVPNGFDVSDDDAVSAASVTLTTATTSQASELLLALDMGYDSSSDVQALTTDTAGWTQLADNTPVVPSLGIPTNRINLAAFSQVVSTVGTQTITIDSDTGGGDQTHKAILLTYKGWNPDANPEDDTDTFLFANDNDATYDIWSITRATIDTGTWATIDTSLGDTTGVARPVQFALGLGYAWYTAPSFDGLRRYAGTAETVTGSPVGATSLAFHRERMWAAHGSRVSFSQVNDGSTWPSSTVNTGAGYFDISAEDGEDIECIAPFAGMLVIAKRTSVHVITGRNRDEFSLEPLSVSVGGAPGKCIIPTPYGAIIAGVDMVYLFDGETISIIGRPVEQSYHVLGEDEYVWGDYIDGSCYIACGALGKTFVFNFEAKNWRIEQVGDEGSAENPTAIFSYAGLQVMSPREALIGSLGNYRSFPNPVRGKDFDTVSEFFLAETGHLAFGGPRHPHTPRNLYLQLRQRFGDPAETGIIVTPTFDGEDGTACPVGSGNAGARREVVAGYAQMSGVETSGFRLEHEAEDGATGVYDIEAVYLDFKVEANRA